MVVPRLTSMAVAEVVEQWALMVMEIMGEESLGTTTGFNQAEAAAGVQAVEVPAPMVDTI